MPACPDCGRVPHISLRCNVTVSCYPVKVGRLRQHGAQTAVALLDATEAILQESGPSALSVRAVAARIGTTTRAVYSVYDSKEGLLVALAVRAFDTLGAGITELPTTDDPAADLVAAGVTVFRRFTIEHPWLFRIAVQHAVPSAQLTCGSSAAAVQAFSGVIARVRRLEQAGLLGVGTVEQAACAFHALCEGLAAMELRGGMQQPGVAEQIWRGALGSLVAGFAVPPRTQRPGRVPEPDRSRVRPELGDRS